MALKDYYLNDKKEIVEKLSEATMTSKSTVYKWFQGEITPPPIKRQIIANVMGVPIKDLFPDDRT